MVTPSSGPAAANPAGSKSRNKPRPAMPGGGVFVHGAGFLCLADVGAVRLPGSLLRSFLKKAAPKTSFSTGYPHEIKHMLNESPLGVGIVLFLRFDNEDKRLLEGYLSLP